jgi:hypothetical protein
MQVPGGFFDAKAPGGHRVEASVGQPGPAGPAANATGHRIHFGFAPFFDP